MSEPLSTDVSTTNNLYNTTLTSTSNTAANMAMSSYYPYANYNSQAALAGLTNPYMNTAYSLNAGAASTLPGGYNLNTTNAAGATSNLNSLTSRINAVNSTSTAGNPNLVNLGGANGTAVTGGDVSSASMGINGLGGTDASSIYNPAMYNNLGYTTGLVGDGTINGTGAGGVNGAVENSNAVKAENQVNDVSAATGNAYGN